MIAFLNEPSGDLTTGSIKTPDGWENKGGNPIKLFFRDFRFRPKSPGQSSLSSHDFVLIFICKDEQDYEEKH
jgi:hypothetical protein